MHGVRGVQGVQGMHGVRCVQGVQGMHGVRGVQGVQGMHGVRGVQGVQGMHGVRGVQCVKGMYGVRGVQGVQSMHDILRIASVHNISKRLVERKMKIMLFQIASRYGKPLDNTVALAGPATPDPLGCVYTVGARSIHKILIDVALYLDVTEVEFAAVLSNEVELTAVLSNEVELTAALSNEVELTAALSNEVELTAVLSNEVELTAVLSNEVEWTKQQIDMNNGTDTACMTSVESFLGFPDRLEAQALYKEYHQFLQSYGIVRQVVE
ncbi:hypothetical protein RRG08_004584 [Elysia crispata]|uniref:Uncharacterized protein n=1 Tax=Elysia crispata TaxID=231223 RepID=A0AAE1AKW2_9GAST|nr:hypothetical protein RRG08_004584 [Elysia crispata]